MIAFPKDTAHASQTGSTQDISVGPVARNSSVPAIFGSQRLDTLDPEVTESDATASLAPAPTGDPSQGLATSRLARCVEPGEAGRFRQLADAWQRKSSLLSSTTAICTLPEYQQIIGMGRAALPFIFQELERTPGHWFWALVAITGEDPVASESKGRVREMAATWLELGQRHGYA